jgi:hypothetical protein
MTDAGMPIPALVLDADAHLWDSARDSNLGLTNAVAGKGTTVRTSSPTLLYLIKGWRQLRSMGEQQLIYAILSQSLYLDERNTIGR